MKRLLCKLAFSAALLGASGCALIEGDSQAGDLGRSNFGEATANNTVVQAVRLRGGLLADLRARFRRAAPDTVNFAFNRSDLDASAQAALDQQAAFIIANPAIGFRVIGHTDLVGSNGYNRALGLRRARAAVNYLVARGVPRRQVRAVVSQGESQPLVNTRNRERLNRRTVTQVFGVTRDGRPFDFDGKAAANIYTGYVESYAVTTTTSAEGG